MKIGYARVSTDGQSLESQLEQLENVGCSKIFSEKISGARSDRAELAKTMARLEAGDILIVTRLDRLARSTRDLLNVLDVVSKRNAGFKSLADVWADTTTAHGRLIITVLAGLAEFERELIKARTSEGRERAIKAGIKMGRKPKLSAHQKTEVRGRKANGESLRFLARSYGVSPNTILRA